MPTETPVWFNTEDYLANKAAQLNAIAYEGSSEWTAQQVADNFAQAGLTAYEHFVQYGNAENVSPNDYFNVSEYIVAKANALNAAAYQDRTDWSPADVLKSFDDAGLSAWDHYTQYGAAEGLNPSNDFNTQAYLQAKADQLNQDSYEGRNDWTIADVEASIAAAGLNPIEHYYLYGREEGLSVSQVPAGEQVTVPDTFNPWNPDYNPDNPNPPSEDIDWNAANQIYLTEGRDSVQGEDGVHNLFIAQEFDGVNTLQTGDRIVGGNETDMLLADVTAGNTFGQILNSVRPQVEDVEILKFSSQQSTNTVTGATATAGIRADRIQGATELWSSESRASLSVDDVRIDSNKMLIGFQNADRATNSDGPDYTVRFNNQYLKADDASSSGQLTLELIDAEGAVENEPLLQNVYSGLRFYYNGNLVTLRFGLVNGAGTTYDDLRDAIQAAIDADPALAGLTVGVGERFDARVALGPNSGTQVFGNQIIIKAASGTLEGGTGVPGTGWMLEQDTALPDSNLSATMDSEGDTTCPLIRTDIALDNVGMVEWNEPGTCIPDNQQFGDYAGDMVVGGMGNGNYVGIQRFDVTVDRGSWLSSLASTNNALRMITVKNGDLDDADKETGTSAADLGNLFIGDGQRLTDESVAGGSLMFEGRDGLLRDVPVGYNQLGSNPSGIVDVKTFDASAMVGKANISAALTDLSSTKYLGDTDQVDGLGNRFAPDGNFEYKFGSNDDTLSMGINGYLAADADFRLDINMGDGDNSVQTRLMAPGNQAQWLPNQIALRNVNITTGAGDDIINPYGYGATNVYAGAGNDVVYSNNAGIYYGSLPPAANALGGVGAVYILNAAGRTFTELGVSCANGEIVPIRDGIVANTNNAYNATGLTLQDGRSVRIEVDVTYKGVLGTYEKAFDLTADANGTTGSLSIRASQLNQMIADAVNNDADSYLSSLLSAKEGAGFSLMFLSKIDGLQTLDDLNISIRAYQGTSTLDIASTMFVGPDDSDGNPTYMGAYGDNNSSDGNLQFAKVENESGQFDVVGANSWMESHNRIDLGAGNDLAVLSTDVNSSDVVVLGNYDNGKDTIVNFDVKTEAGVTTQDKLDISAILRGAAGTTQILTTPNTEANPESNITSGTATALTKSVVFVNNTVASNNAAYIDNAADLLAQIQANGVAVTNNISLFLVYDGADATFDMYRVNFGATTNAAPTVTALGVLDIADVTVDDLTTNPSVFVG